MTHALRKAQLFFLILLLAGPAAWAQTPTWQTADVLAPTSYSPTTGAANMLGSQSIVPDGQGNLYMAGYFYGSVTLGTTTLSTSDPNVFTFRSGYVAKWNIASRQVVWAVQTTGQLDQFISQLVVQGNNLYVAGAFKGTTATFGGTTLTNTDATGYYLDGFVAKLVDNGSSARFVWAQGLGGSSHDDYARGLAVNGANLYVSGQFVSSTINFGAIALTNNTTVGSAFDIFVAKMTDNGATGSFVWAQRAGGNGNDQAWKMASNGPNVYFTGVFDSNTAAFGAITLTKTSANNHFRNAYVAKLADNGSTGGFTWVIQDDIDGFASNMTVSGNNVYLASTFSGTSVLGTTTLTSAGNSDLLVAKLTDAGTTASYAWIKQAGGPGNDYCVDVAVQGNTVYATGNFTGPSLGLGATTLANATPLKSEGYLAKLTDAGSTASFTWADRFGGSDNDSGSSLVLAGGKVHMVGYATVPATFGSVALSGTAATNTPFLTTLADGTLAATAKPASLAFSLYPNPARATATVQLPAAAGSAAVTITLLDGLGRAVRTSTVPAARAGQRHELPLNGMPAGMYSVRVTAGAASSTQQLAVY